MSRAERLKATQQTEFDWLIDRADVFHKVFSELVQEWESEG